jgi:hypothetical protein
MIDTGAPMRVSHAEVLQTCFKALEGLGLPPGLDYDAASNVTWLEARGLGGVGILAGELKRFGDEVTWSMPRIDDDGRTATIAADDPSGVLLAPGALDWAVAGRTVQVLECAAPMLVMAEAARRSIDGVALTVSWGIDRGKSTAKCGGGLAALSLDIRTARAPAVVTIRAGKPPSPKDGRRLAGFYAQSLQHGLVVDPIDWALIKQAAKAVLVPASALSRSGAGAEVDDSA